jgi:hypothetical protein
MGQNGADLDTERLPGALQARVIHKAMEMLRMLAQNDLEREKHGARLKYQRDEAARLQDAMAMGEQIGCIQQAERLLGQAQTPREILRATTLDQLRRIADGLEAQLGARR